MVKNTSSLALAIGFGLLIIVSIVSITALELFICFLQAYILCMLLVLYATEHDNYIGASSASMISYSTEANLISNLYILIWTGTCLVICGLIGLFINRYSFIKVLIALDFITVGFFLISISFGLVYLNYSLFLFGLIMLFMGIIETIILVIVFVYSRSKRSVSKYGPIYSKFMFLFLAAKDPFHLNPRPAEMTRPKTYEEY